MAVVIDLVRSQRINQNKAIMHRVFIKLHDTSQTAIMYYVYLTLPHQLQKVTYRSVK